MTKLKQKEVEVTELEVGGGRITGVRNRNDQSSSDNRSSGDTSKEKRD